MNSKKAEELAQGVVDALCSNGYIARHGNYQLDYDVAIDAITQVIMGEDSHLSEYDSLIFLSWDTNKWLKNYKFDPAPDISIEDSYLWNEALNSRNYWNIYVMFSDDTIKRITDYVTNGIKTSPKVSVEEKESKAEQDSEQLHLIA